MTFLLPESNMFVLRQRHGEPPVVAVLVLAEQADAAILVEVRPGGGAASWSGLAGAPGFPPDALDPGCSRCLASQHHTGPFPFLQVGSLHFSSSFFSLKKKKNKFCFTWKYQQNTKRTPRKRLSCLSLSSFLIDDSIYLLNTEKMGVKVD